MGGPFTRAKWWQSCGCCNSSQFSLGFGGSSSGWWRTVAAFRTLGFAWREDRDYDVVMIYQQWFYLRWCIDCADNTVDGNHCLCHLGLKPSTPRAVPEEVSIHDVMGQFY